MSFDRDQFRDEVKARVDLAAWITGDGVPLKGQGREWTALCPFHQEKTPSFNVFQKDGSWGFHCFGCGAGGDIFEWVMRRKGYDFKQALAHVASAMSMTLPDAGRRLYQPREARAAAEPAPVRGPVDPDKFAPLAPDSPATRYLTGARRLPADLLAAYNVGQTADGAAYAFAYKWHPAGSKHHRFEFCKVVKVERPDGKKVEWREPKGGRNILFGMMTVPADCERLVIAEGEIDAITWAHYAREGGANIGAVSVPGGAGYLGWIAICWDWLARFKRIHVSFDEDRAGRSKVIEVVQRLGMARTDMVRLPEKAEA